jgi:microcystin-dependent protein
MPSTFSPSLRIELIGEGEQSGVWGTTTNSNLGSLIEQAITGTTNLDVTAGDITLTSLNGLVDQARSAVLAVTGTPGVTRVLTIPNVNKNYTVQNATANIVQVKTPSGSAFNCPALSQSYIVCDGANVVTGRSITDGANTITSNAAPFNSPTFTGVPIAPTAAIGTNTTQLATTAFVQSSIPVGLITLWSGSIASIPSGWALCNGSSGTPDLRDRFVVGAGSAYAVAATGGFNTITLDTTQIPSHTHTGTTAATDLSHTHTGSDTTGGNNVDHSHTGSGTTGGQNANHGHSGSTDSQGNHNHGLIVDADSGAGAGPYFKADGQAITTNFTNDAGIHNHNVSTGIQNADHGHAYSFTTSGQSTSHNHSFSFTTSGASVSMSHTHTFTSDATGGGLAHENRPPYYALAYIMKV